jgi:MFS family permease
MEGFYWVLLLAAGAVAAALDLSALKSEASLPRDFLGFRNTYIVVYSMMMSGDWLQGPYVYALYSHYGYDVGAIGKLFIAGFGSSLLFGTVVGSLADKWGRKRAGLLYVAAYVLSCVTKHSPNYGVLMLGRFFGGIATSLLFSAFESWVVAEHTRRGYDEAWISGLFSKAIFFGNGLVAILCGLLANSLVYTAELGPVAPFDAAICVLLAGGLIIFLRWGENYGTISDQSIVQQYTHALSIIRGDRRVFLLGAIQSCFEGAMYTFVFLWTPALSPNGEEIPHGFIFAIFMACSMCGSALASRLMSTPSTSVESYMRTVMMVAALCLAVPVLVPDMGGSPGSGLPLGGQIKLLAFLGFEVCVGIFWPSLMKLRSRYVPEEVRSTIMNLFRVPLNLFVCVVLYNASLFPVSGMFSMCVVLLLVSLGSVTALEKHTRQAGMSAA